MQVPFLETDKDASDLQSVIKPKARRFRAEWLANFGVQYNYSNIYTVLHILGKGNIWYEDSLWGGYIFSIMDSVIFLGSIIGMCTMGYYGDTIGRNRALAVTSLVMVMFSIASALAPNGDNADVALGSLAACRFGLGFGVGGCYPLSAVKSAEECRGTTVADKNFDVGTNLFWQVIGTIAPYIVAAMLDAWCSDTMLQFRLCLAVGALPPLVVLYSLWGVEESDEFRESRHARRLLVNTDFGRGGGGRGGGRVRVQSFGTVKSSMSSSSRALPTDELVCLCNGRVQSGRDGVWEHLRLGFGDSSMCKQLAATALTYLLYDIAYYGGKNFTPTMNTAFIKSGDDSSDDGDVALSIAVHNYLAAAVGIPAVLHGLWMLRRIGTKRLQVWGFLLIALTCAILAIIWTPLQPKSSLHSNVLFACYLAFVSATSWGPMLTLYVLPQELFKVEIRSTFNGIAAASGKVGAVLGIWIFKMAGASFGIVAVMAIVAVLNLLGAFISQMYIPDELWRRQQAQSEEAAARRTRPVLD